MTQPVLRSEWSPGPGFVGPPALPPLPVEPSILAVDSPASANSNQPDAGVEALPDPRDAPIQWLKPSSASAVAPVRDASKVGAALDATLQRFMPTFRTLQGYVAVPIGFHMTIAGIPGANENPRLTAALQKAGFGGAAIAQLVAGRGSPEQIAQATQALIDAGHLPRPAENDTPGMRIRRMTNQLQLGIDCAGYVAEAALAARAVTRKVAGFAAPMNESLSNLAAQGYTRLPGGAAYETGDIFVLHGNPPRPGLPPTIQDPGHRAIVRSFAAASSSEIAAVKASWALPTDAQGSNAWDKIEVDSSWGGMRGVERHTWWHDRTSDVWAWTTADGQRVVTDGPYAHPSFDVYRFGSPR